jgi:ketosteroid isomerase-like protein
MDAIDVVRQFNEAWMAHDLEATLAMMTDDARFESTGPFPDGTVFAGHEAIRGAWAEIFANTSSRFIEEETLAAGPDAVVFRWTYDWGDGHIRGIDLFKVREGKVSEKLSYVKG